MTTTDTTDPDVLAIRAAIMPKSDQLNADDLVGRSIVVRILGVKVLRTPEQPVTITISDHKPYKPCKGMQRVLVQLIGEDPKTWVGRWLLLYRDPEAKWAGEPVGGIRIGGISGIQSDCTVPVTINKKQRAQHEVKRLTPPTASPEEQALAAFQSVAKSAVTERGWTPDQRLAVLKGRKTADVPATERAAIVERLSGPPPADGAE